MKISFFQSTEFYRWNVSYKLWIVATNKGHKGLANIRHHNMLHTKQQTYNEPVRKQARSASFHYNEINSFSFSPSTSCHWVLVYATQQHLMELTAISHLSFVNMRLLCLRSRKWKRYRAREKTVMWEADAAMSTFGLMFYRHSLLPRIHDVKATKYIK